MAGLSAGISQAAPEPEYSLVDVVLEAAQSPEGEREFTILLAAVLAADPAVVETLSSKGQHTVFAPTDEAFVNLLGELRLEADELLNNTELVTQVLLYHVVKGRRDSSEVLESSRLRTLEGSFLFQEGGELTDSNGRVASIVIEGIDIEADNGIIHVIDTVVLP